MNPQVNAISIGLACEPVGVAGGSRPRVEIVKSEKTADLTEQLESLGTTFLPLRALRDLLGCCFHCTTTSKRVLIGIRYRVAKRTSFPLKPDDLPEANCRILQPQSSEVPLSGRQ